MLQIGEEKKMTAQEVADILGVSAEAIKKHVREVYPELLKNGIQTLLTEEQVHTIKKRMIPTTQVVGAVTALDIEEMTIKVIQYHKAEAERLRAENAAMLPKAQFYDRVADSETAIDMATVAKVLNLPYGRNTLFAILRGKKILMADNRPYQDYVNRGYFRVIEEPYTIHGETHINIKTHVYQKGLEYIAKVTAA